MSHHMRTFEQVSYSSHQIDKDRPRYRPGRTAKVPRQKSGQWSWIDSARRRWNRLRQQRPIGHRRLRLCAQIAAAQLRTSATDRNHLPSKSIADRMVNVKREFGGTSETPTESNSMTKPEPAKDQTYGDRYKTIDLKGWFLPRANMFEDASGRGTDCVPDCQHFGVQRWWETMSGVKMSWEEEKISNPWKSSPPLYQKVRARDCNLWRFIRQCASTGFPSADANFCSLTIHNVTASQAFDLRRSKEFKDSIFWAISWDVEGKSVGIDGKEGNLIGMIVTRQDPSYRKYSGTWNSFSARKVDSLITDYGVFRDWIRICDTSHGRACKREKQRVAGFRLINCSTRTIIRANRRTSYKYTALSYRWQSTTPASIGVNQRIQYDAPLIIRDAIRVTQELGYKYLWIDQYCIPQDSPEEKMHQIRNMDAIYAGAEVSIIACPSRTPRGYDYGLPGVSLRPRISQPCYGPFKFADNSNTEVIMVSALPPFRLAIEDSEWSERAWTYQEAILSPRLLCFTDFQVYFACNSLEFRESIQPPGLLVYGARRKTKLAERNRGIPFGVGMGRTALLDRIMEYSQRRITVPTDNLNGIQGVISVFARRAKVQHLFGVPILPVAAFHSEREFNISPRSVENRFAWGLTWRFSNSGWNRPDRSFRCFSMGRAPERVPDLPSWSWTGWTMPSFIQYDREWNDIHEAAGYVNWGHIKYDIRICVELICGTVKSLEETLDLSRVPAGHNRISKFLVIEGWVAGYGLDDEEVSYHNAALYRKEGKWGATVDNQCLCATHRPWGNEFFDPLEAWLIVNYDDNQRHECIKTALIIRNLGTHWERVGVVRNVHCPGLFWVDRSCRGNPYSLKRRKIKLG